MITLNGAKKVVDILQASQPQRPTEQDAYLAALETELFAMSLADKLTWLDSELAQLSGDSKLYQFLSDWQEFLKAKADPNAYIPDWNNEIKRFAHTPNSRRSGEIYRRWGWSGWNGEGLPPQLRPDSNTRIRYENA